jgi:hypothetical protein
MYVVLRTTPMAVLVPCFDVLTCEADASQDPSFGDGLGHLQSQLIFCTIVGYCTRI